MSIKINEKEMTGELTLDSSHSIILGHKPNKISNEDLSSQLQSDHNCTDIESFGLWEVASPNYVTYYPEVTADDLNPKDEEFITPVFRGLSEVIVNKGYRPIDFGKPGVLRKSMNMLIGQTINIDHEVAVGNAIGSVSAVYWQKAYKTKSGIEVPAGINCVFKIDGKSNPRIARGIMMEPPSIHSNSVTVRFKWEPSHTLEDMSEFWDKLGSYDAEGQMYRLIVVQIISYSETSLVSHGADVYAQKVKPDGEINDPEYADRQFSFSVDKEGREINAFVFDYKSELNLSADDNSIPTQINNNKSNQQNNSNMDELIKSFISELGFTDADGLTKENVVAKLKEKYGNLGTEVTQLKADKAALEADKIALANGKAELTTKVESFEANKAEMDSITSQTRLEASKLYKLVKDKDADANILSLIETADLKSAGAFVKQYQKEADEKFTQTCSDCGGHNVSRASAQATKEGLILDGEDDTAEKTTRTVSEVRNSLLGKKKKESLILKQK